MFAKKTPYIGVFFYTKNMHRIFFEEARQIAELASCLRARCGAVVVSEDGQIIGRGYNAPPLEDESQRMCEVELDQSIKQNNDKTCCVHAEWNAILDALKNQGDKVKGATLYFMRVDDKGEFADAGDPYCTVCSRLALESGIARFGLWQSKPVLFGTADYNQQSYAYFQ